MSKLEKIDKKFFFLLGNKNNLICIFLIVIIFLFDRITKIKIIEHRASDTVSINDFIIFKNNDLYNYIFLCEIRVNDEFLKEININKKINIIAKNIELDFINKYSKLYNTKKYYE